MSENKSAKFWNRFADRYSRHAIADTAAYQKKLQKTQSYFRPDMEVLEFGCGTGSTAIYHAPLVKHILAIDFSSEMIRICRDKVAAAGIKNVDFQCSSFDEFNAADETYDVVLGLNILHLLDNWRGTVQRVHKVLKPGGAFVTSTPCVGDSYLKFLRHIAMLGNLFSLLPRFQAFPERELIKCLTNSGFVIDYQWRPKKNAAVFIVAKKE